MLSCNPRSLNVINIFISKLLIFFGFEIIVRQDSNILGLCGVFFNEFVLYVLLQSDLLYLFFSFTHLKYGV